MVVTFITKKEKNEAYNTGAALFTTCRAIKYYLSITF